MMSRLCHLVLLSLLLVFGKTALAHEVRPASLEITESADGVLEFRWRQPILGEYTISLQPSVSSGWLTRDPDRRIITETGLIQLWRIQPGDTALTGQTLSIRGLDRTITDVFVSISRQHKATITHLIKAANPLWVIPGESVAGTGIAEYLWLGLSHIWSGPDHLLYIFALMLLISNTRSLILTISCFTLAHSITLACAALKLVQLRTVPVEAVISLSIVYVAIELIHKQQGRVGLAQQRPWLIAFIFGLLHGFGFAGALQDIGLPQQAALSALLLFNTGIEAGQLLFVFSLLCLYWWARQCLPTAQKTLQKILRLSPYAIGSLASFWLIERLILLL